MVSKFCSQAGKGLQSCRQKGRSKAYCSKKSKELLSCRSGSTGKKKDKVYTSSGGGDPQGQDSDEQYYDPNTGEMVVPMEYNTNEWYPLETEGYFVMFDDEGYYIRDPTEKITYTEDDSEIYNNNFTNASNESIGTIKESSSQSSQNACCCKH
jgi:hypothetical protein